MQIDIIGNISTNVTVYNLMQKICVQTPVGISCHVLSETTLIDIVYAHIIHILLIFRSTSLYLLSPTYTLNVIVPNNSCM